MTIGACAQARGAARASARAARAVRRVVVTVMGVSLVVRWGRFGADFPRRSRPVHAGYPQSEYGIARRACACRRASMAAARGAGAALLNLIAHGFVPPVRRMA